MRKGDFGRHLRQLRTLLWTALFLLLLSTAVLVATARLLSPYVFQAKPWLSRVLSQNFGAPVKIGMVGVEWQGLTPELDLKQVTIGDAAGVIDLRQLRLRFEWYNYLLPWRQPWQLALRGAELVAEHDAAGWHLHGLAGSGEPFDLGGLFGLGGVDLKDCDFIVVTADRRVPLHLKSLEVRRQGGGFAVAGRLALVGVPDIEVRGAGSLGAERTWRAYLGAENQPLAAWFGAFGIPLEDASAKADLELWLERQHDETLKLSAHFKLGMGGAAPAETFDGLLWGRVGHAGRWAFTLGDAQQVSGRQRTPSVPGISLSHDHNGWSFIAEKINLKTFAPFAALARQAGIDWAPNEIAGWIEHLAFDTDAAFVPRNADVTFSDIVWVAAGGVKLRSFSGHLFLENGSGEVQSAGTLEAPSIFIEEMPFSALHAAFSVVPGAGQRGSLRFNVPRFSGLAGELELDGAGWFLTGKNPWLDMTLAIPGADIATIKRRLPYGVMGPNTGRWLRASLEAGALYDIRAQLQGAIGDWPFASGTGSFEAEGRLRQGRLRFNPCWPVLDKLDARLHFTAREMRIDQVTTDFGGVPVERVAARIADMDAPVLELEAVAGGDAGTFLDLLGSLPIAAGSWVKDSELALAGPSRVITKLNIDFRDDQSDTKVDGEVHFAGVEARYAKQVKIDSIEGVLAFDEKRVIPSALTAAWRKYPQRLEFHDAPFAISLSGAMPLADIFDLAGLDAFWQGQVAGDSIWHWTLIPAQSGTRLLASSALFGTRLDLPEPFNKPAEMPLLLAAELDFGEPMWLGIDLGGRLAASLLLHADDGIRGGALALGQHAAGLAHPGWMALAGEGGELDLSGWLAAIAAAPAADLSGALNWRIDARPDRLEIFGRSFAATAMRLTAREQFWQADFAGPKIAGQVRIPLEMSSGEPLLADFARLYLPPGQTTTSSAGVDPRTLPSVHLYAADFRWEDWDLGAIRVQAFPVAGGLSFETIEAISPTVRLTGQGDWLKIDNQARSSARMTFDAEKLGELLTRLGYDPILQGGQTAVTLSGEWPGGPADFTLASLDGELKLDIRQGNITEAGAGAGRVLGLISLQALPRRLLLDFRDVFKSGFTFDRAQGSFQLAAGYAATDDLEISAPNARLLITGRTDLIRRRYDQQLIVIPGIGSALPLIGALAGPLGIAAGAALQGIIGKPLGGLSQRVYTITGPWSEPSIELKSETAKPSVAGNGGAEQDGGPSPAGAPLGAASDLSAGQTSGDRKTAGDDIASKATRDGKNG